jgi:tryptophanyl-tRNA synthetase
MDTLRGMPRIFSGIQPTGELHIGNWLGAVRNWVELQDQYDCIFCIVDLHAITGAFYDPAEHARRTREMAVGLLASGIDPERAVLFVQSHVPEHSELMWLLNAVTHVGELERMTQFKDKSAGHEAIPAGLLNYPILMAADILLDRADSGRGAEDLGPHLAHARAGARRWNNTYAGGKAVLPEAEALLTEAKRFIGLDGDSKMSKSKGNTIGILDTPEEIWQKLRTAKTDPARKRRTDPGTPEICNIYHLHRYFSPPDTVQLVADNCRGAKWGCLDCKRVLADNMSAVLAPIRERAAELNAAPAKVDEILHAGARRARALASETMAIVHDHMGFMRRT